MEPENFESKINKFFKKYNLKELPNYFFGLVELKPINGNKKDKVKNIKEAGTTESKINDIVKENPGMMNMDYIDKNYFSSYIEIDGAFAYFGKSLLTIINENNKKFKVSKSINVSLEDGIKINDGDTNNFILDKNSILLIEDKLRFPSVIRNLTRNKLIEKDKLYKSLNLVVYKTIKKINIFNEYLRSISLEKNIDYSYYLLLIYYSNPIAKIENIIKDILLDLKNENLIKYPKFKLKVIYILPYISLNDSEGLEKLENEIKLMKEEMEVLKQRVSYLESQKDI